MNNKELAEKIIEFVKGLDNFWDGLRNVVLQKLAVLYLKAKELSVEALETEDKFIDILAEMIDIYWQAGILEPIDKAITKLVLGKVIVPLIKRIIGDNWFDQLKQKIEEIKIVDNKVIDSTENVENA